MEEQPEINPDAPVEEEHSKKSAHYWTRWIKAAKEAAERHWHDARAAWAEYDWTDAQEDPKYDRRATRQKRTYPIYWSSCKVIEPALYARTPQPTTKRRFSEKDTIALVASTAAERLAEYMMECCEFDSTMMSAVQDFLHADKATAQLLYDYDIEQREVRTQLMPMDETGTMFADESGLEYLGDVLQDEMGFYGMSVEEVKVNKRIRVVPLCFDDVLHTPNAKHESEIKEQAYYFCLTREEAEAAFDEDVLREMTWLTRKSNDDEKKREQEEAERETLEQILEGWEIYDFDNKEIVVWTEQHSDRVISRKPDPYGLREFFPSPKFIISNKPSKSMYPRPAFVYLQPTLEQLHHCKGRLHRLIDGVRRRALVEGASPELLAALNSLNEGEYVTVTNLNQIIEKGGIEGMVYWVPVQELVQAIGEMAQLQETFKNEIFEWFGVPDILRGQTDPIEAEGTQRLKTQAAHDRFKYMKKQVQQLARDLMEMMVDLALREFTDEELFVYCGIEFMDDAEKAVFPQALQLLRSDEARMIRLDIATDSMTFVDEGIRAAHTNQAVQTITSGMQSVAAAAQIDVGFGHVALQALLKSLDTIGPGKEFAMSVQQAAQTLLDRMANPPEPPPPPPDYEGQKLALQSQQMMLDNQLKMRELDRKEYEAMQKAQKEQMEMQLNAMRAQLEEMLAQWSIQTDTHKMAMEEAQMRIAQFKANQEALEMQLEEVRLAREVDGNIMANIADMQNRTSEVQRQMQQSPVVVNIAMPQQQQRRARIVFDEFDNAQIIEETPAVIEQSLIQRQVDPYSGAPIMLPEYSGQGSVNFTGENEAELIVDELLRDLDNGE